MERWLITGSNGFLGSNLVRSLSDQEVRCLRREEYKRPSQAVTEFKPDYIVNLAVYGNMYDQTDLNEIMQANVYNLLELLEASQKVDYKGLVVISSSSVTLPEQTIYSASKVAGEKFAKMYADKDKPTVIVRPYSITGFDEQPKHLIPTLIRSCLKGEPMKFTPTPVHDFIDIQDFTNALVLVARNAQDHRGEVFDIGSGKMYSNKEVLALVEEATGGQANITEIVDSMRSYDTDKWVADTTKIESLGWKPKKDLRQSIEEMVKNYGKQK